MPRQYPRVGNKIKSQHNFYRKTCEFCGKLGTLRIDLQINYMRGDDEVFILCDEHKTMTAQELYLTRYLPKEASRG